MNAAETPQLVAMARVLREGLVPAWSDEDVARAVSQALRDLELPTARRVAALCWSRPDTEHPGRVRTAGPWWTAAGLKPPSQRVPEYVPDAAVSQRGAAKAWAALNAAKRQEAVS